MGIGWQMYVWVHVQDCQSAVNPVFVLFGATFLRADFLHDIVGLDDGGDEVVGLVHDPLGGKGLRPRELEARVAVVTHSIPLAPRPKVSEMEKI